MYLCRQYFLIFNFILFIKLLCFCTAIIPVATIAKHNEIVVFTFYLFVYCKVNIAVVCCSDFDKSGKKCENHTEVNMFLNSVNLILKIQLISAKCIKMG